MSFDHLPPRASTYWRELAERSAKTGRYYRGRTRELAKRVLFLEGENRALRVERDALEVAYRQSEEARRDLVEQLKRFRTEIDYLKAVARDLKAAKAMGDD